MAGVMELLQGLLGMGSAQAAEPPNPMGKVLPFPGTRQPGVLGEGGGGGLAPQPPNRFKEIMGDIDAEVARRSQERQGRTPPGEYYRTPQREPDLLDQPPQSGPTGFMARRNAQLRQEREAQAAATVDRSLVAADRISNRRAAGEAWVASWAKPKVVTPELTLERQLGIEAPTVSHLGHVVQNVPGGGLLVVNPHTGATRARIPYAEGGGANIPFRTRAEALEYLATKPSAAQARAKEDLQRQRLRTQGPDPFDQ